MNRRKLKKIARRYLDGGNVSRYVRGIFEYPTGFGWFQAEAMFSKGLNRAICAESYLRGWDGYWRDSPFLVYSGGVDGEDRNGFAATCCKAARRVTAV